MPETTELPAPRRPGPPPPEIPFLDVPVLLETSQPRPQIPRTWYLIGGFVLVSFLTVSLGASLPRMHAAIEVLSGVLVLGLMGGLSAVTFMMVRKYRAEQQQVEAAGELLQLRRWPESAVILEQFLSRPARNDQLRTQALIYLASLLLRYHRFQDAVTVQEHLLDNDSLGTGTAYGVRVGRAMAMLSEEHLFDADRAISELRRYGSDVKESAGLALVELYRDVKTGHPAEAIEVFERGLPALREQLGHRVADAYALVARAYDLVGRTDDAKTAWENATTLAPPGELIRRYPEVQKLQGRYAPAIAPPEAA